MVQFEKSSLNYIQNNPSIKKTPTYFCYSKIFLTNVPGKETLCTQSRDPPPISSVKAGLFV